MKPGARTAVFLFGAVLTGLAALTAVLGLPPFGSAHHPYGAAAIVAAVAHQTSNAVSSVNFDSRGLDTLIEELVLLGSVLGVSVLLRPNRDEQERRVPETGRILPSSVLVGYLLLPVTAVVGLGVIAHGQQTPGGGFQGGIVVGTAVHLLYVAGSFRAVEGIRPLDRYAVAEAVGAGGFAVTGVAGLVATGSFLANVLPRGTFGDPFAGGTVALLNGLVGVEVVAGTVVLLAHFLDQEILVRTKGDAS